jgi:hypothetical protein
MVERWLPASKDNGRPFDPTRVPSPTLASSLEEAKASDLGIHLMRAFASSMQYERGDGWVKF